VYVALFLALFNLNLIVVAAIGLVVGFIAWVIFGGWQLIAQPLSAKPVQLGHTNR
jgi:hypothetical protein